MMHSDRVVLVVLVAMVGLVTAGCGQTAPPQPSKPAAITDACAERLHEISGAFLHYYALHRQLPETLEDLRNEPGIGTLPPFICPISRALYAYHPDGLEVPEQAGLIILNDEAAGHPGFRWAIRISDPKGGAPLVARVVAVPEDRWKQAKPAARTSPGTEPE